MKRILLLSFFILGSLSRIWSDEFDERLLDHRMQLMSQDLETHDFDRLFHYFCPQHFSANIEMFWEDSFIFSDQAIEMAILNWGFIYDDYRDALESIHRINIVLDYHIAEERVTFELMLDNGETVYVYAFINWDNLGLYGAAG